MFVLAMPALASTIATIIFESHPSNDTYDGAYVGIYRGLVGNSKTLTNFVCDDYLHTIHGGMSWSAYVNSSNPPTGDEFSPGSITDPDVTGITQQLQEYNMITWLVEQIFLDPSNSKGQWGAFSGAIWSITDDAWANGNDPTKGESDLYTKTTYGGLTAQEEVLAALGHANDTTLPVFTVFTPTGSTGQEFYGTEPAIPVLLGCTFLGVGMLRKRLSA